MPFRSHAATVPGPSGYDYCHDAESHPHAQPRPQAVVMAGEGAS